MINLAFRFLPLIVTTPLALALVRTGDALWATALISAACVAVALSERKIRRSRAAMDTLTARLVEESPEEGRFLVAWVEDATVMADRLDRYQDAREAAEQLATCGLDMGISAVVLEDTKTGLRLSVERESGRIVARALHSPTPGF